MGVFINAHGQPSAAISGLRQVRAQSTSWYHHRGRRRPSGLSYARRWLNHHYAPSRLNTFSISCSLVNTDVCHSIETGEVHEDTMSLEQNCLIPVVHLESDTLETEGLNLLVGDSYVDTILTTLPRSRMQSLPLLLIQPGSMLYTLATWLGIQLNSSGILLGLLPLHRFILVFVLWPAWAFLQSLQLLLEVL